TYCGDAEVDDGLLRSFANDLVELLLLVAGEQEALTGSGPASGSQALRGAEVAQGGVENPASGVFRCSVDEVGGFGSAVAIRVDVALRDIAVRHPVAVHRVVFGAWVVAISDDDVG